MSDSAQGRDCTETAEGAIPHLQVGGLLCPVVLRGRLRRRKQVFFVQPVEDADGRPYPLRLGNGVLVYALPGGKRITASGLRWVEPASAIEQAAIAA